MSRQYWAWCKMAQPDWLRNLYPLENSRLKHLRAIWVSFNASEDKMETLTITEAFVDYISAFINPEMARNVANSRKYGMDQNLNRKNEDFENRMEEAKAGKVRKLSVREDLAEKAKKVEAMLLRSKVREVEIPEGE